MWRKRAPVALGVAGAIVVVANIMLLAMVVPELTPQTAFPITYATGLVIGFAMLTTASVLQLRDRIDHLTRQVQQLEARLEQFDSTTDSLRQPFHNI